MADQARLIRGRIPPEKMFPAGDSRYTVSEAAVRVAGSEMHIRAIECGDASSDRVVLCVHGWASSVYSFRRLLPTLSDSGVRAIAIDLPGHGLSSKPSNRAVYTLAAMTDCVVACMDALGIARGVLVGHSMGGAICARIARIAPERVDALVLLGPAGFAASPFLKMLRFARPHVIAPLLSHLLRRWMVQLVFRGAYGASYARTDRDVDEYFAPTQFPGFVPAMTALLRDFDWCAGADGSFAAIGVPAAVVAGADDRVVSRRSVERYAAALPKATMTVVERCGHVVPEEAPEAVVRAIRSLIH